jgi:hypothetical protein
MHSATMATGRPLPPPGKTLSKSRPAPLTPRAPRLPAAPKPHVTSELQCCILVPASSCHSSFNCPERTTRSTAHHHRQINRQPRRLESSVSHTKQTPAPPINRQQFTTSRIAPFASRLPRGPHCGPKGMPSRDTNRHSRITNHFTNGASRAAAGFAERVILLDTNGRQQRACIFANSFKTNGRANFYSIQTDDFYSIQIDRQSRSRQPARHVKRRPCTSWRDSLKMLGLR